MKTCPKCGELNGDANSKCYKCGEQLPEMVTANKRYCNYCKGIYAPNVEECPRCKMPTRIYSDSLAKMSGSSESYVETWMYIIAFLIPIVGLILGCIKVSKGDSKGGRNLIITAIVSTVLYAIVVYAMMSRSNAELDAALSEIEDSLSDYKYNKYY